MPFSPSGEVTQLVMIGSYKHAFQVAGHWFQSSAKLHQQSRDHMGLRLLGRGTANMMGFEQWPKTTTPLISPKAFL